MIKKENIEYIKKNFNIYQSERLGFRLRVIGQSLYPQTITYLGLHQDYSANWVASDEELNKIPDEQKCGEIAVKRLLENNRGHWGCLEHSQINFSCGFINHGTWQQARTHRVGISFDIQSFRYTYENIIKAVNNELPIEDVIYFRPVGETYQDRGGKKVTYTKQDKSEDWALARTSLAHYKRRIEAGYPPEIARSYLPFDYLQHGVMSVNLRSLLHFFHVRSKKNAQGEIVEFCNLLLEPAKLWVPEIMHYYEKHYYGKGILAP